MADNVIMDFRDPNPLDFANPKIGPYLKQLRKDQYDPKIFEFLISDEAADAQAEIRVGFTNEFNGESAAAYLYIIGAHAQDKAAGTGATEVTIFGINEDGDPDSEAVTMHATAATEKATTKKWKRFIGAMVTAAGSGGVSAGNILITDTGQGNTYGTITAGQNGTIGARVYVPANYNAFYAYFGAGLVVANVADGEAVAGQGVIIVPAYKNSTVTRLEGDVYWLNTVSQGCVDLNIYKQLIEGANTYYMTFEVVTKADDDNQTAFYHIIIIMYGTTNTLRGLPA